MNYQQLSQALITAIKARDFGTAYTHWTAIKTAADRPVGAPGGFAAWLIQHGDTDITSGAELA